MASMYYIVDLTESDAEEIFEGIRGAMTNEEIAGGHGLRVVKGRMSGDLEIAFSGSPEKLVAAHEEMRSHGHVRPGLLFARTEDEYRALEALAPDAELELEEGVPDAGEPEADDERAMCDRNEYVEEEYEEPPDDDSDPLDDGTIGYDYYGSSWPMREI